MVPMADKQGNAIQFYEQLRNQLQTIKKNKAKIVLGDFNSRIDVERRSSRKL